MLSMHFACVNYDKYLIRIMWVPRTNGVDSDCTLVGVWNTWDDEHVIYTHHTVVLNTGTL